MTPARSERALPFDPQHHYIDAALLQAGDVLLLRGSSKESSLIAIGSLGEYSHAALVVEQGVIVEADDPGVGYTPLVQVLGHVGDEYVHWVRTPYRTTAVDVFRHPDLTPDVSRSVHDRLRGRIEDLYAQPYSQMRRLVGASSLPLFVRPAAERAIDLIMDERQRALDGVFCSELVVMLFSELGLRLFDGDVPAADVSPNRLAVSRLQLQPHVRVPAERQRLLRVSFEMRGHYHQQRRMLAAVSSNRNSVAAAVQRGHELSTQVAETSRLLDAQYAEQQHALLTSAVQDYEGAVRRRDFVQAHRIGRILSRRLPYLDHALDLSNHPTSAEHWAAYEAWNRAHYELMSANALWVLRKYRAIRRSRTAPLLDRVRAWRSRRRMLRELLSIRRTQRLTAPAVAGVRRELTANATSSGPEAEGRLSRG